jgi:hypothetical protein
MARILCVDCEKVGVIEVRCLIVEHARKSASFSQIDTSAVRK